ncbi:hypothetical protein PPL_09597 [Heterostelium album PN500]|uniref:NADH dehydrogenase [ubiquinone] 1 alpha subcomplex assembly factor 3 n=1 Tax=Heterostelium pallidum (strain ATCC 26659 / Pp 5 / PN500) TaxID=670386 RepID=D3BNS6_HETP5|nr:hypothetical protein PPL_09597 [Heterostelium album PN500]EFA76845.1 hypothetical protein PPL_09597 [Heterostelium album PN500]|eukprot:XP_020428977.1 hypothetical protein PPL_09597 [Heterostelium album PN500]
MLRFKNTYNIFKNIQSKSYNNNNGSLKISLFSKSILLSSSSNYNNNNNNNNRYIKRCYTSTKQLDSNNLFDRGGGGTDIITIDGYSQQGFSVNSVLIPGSVVAIPNLCLLWDVHEPAEITVESMAALAIVDPPIEFVIVGTGEARVPLDAELLDQLKRRYHINIEVMSTVNALGTYNILAEEGRRVAAFLICNEACREAKDPYYVSKRDYKPLTNENTLAGKQQSSTSTTTTSSKQKKYDYSDNHSQPFEREYRATKNKEEPVPQQLSFSDKLLIWIAERFRKK